MEGKDTDKSGDGDSAGGELSSQPIGEAGTVNFLSDMFNGNCDLNLPEIETKLEEDAEHKASSPRSKSKDLDSLSKLQADKQLALHIFAVRSSLKQLIVMVKSKDKDREILNQIQMLMEQLGSILKLKNLESSWEVLNETVNDISSFLKSEPLVGLFNGGNVLKQSQFFKGFCHLFAHVLSTKCFEFEQIDPLEKVEEDESMNANQFSFALSLVKVFGSFFIAIDPKLFLELVESNFYLSFLFKSEINDKDKDPANANRVIMIFKTFLDLFQENLDLDSKTSEDTGLQSTLTKIHERIRNRIKEISSSDSELLTYLVMYSQYLNTTAVLALLSEDGQVVDLIHRCLIGDQNINKKKAIYLLKTLVEFINSNPDPFFEENLESSTSSANRNSILISNNVESFNLIWSTFFELFDIFEETQVHIIEPCISKLEVLENSPADNIPIVLPLYFVLLKSLCQHDNRFIVRQGILRLLNTAPGILLKQTSSSSQMTNTRTIGLYQKFLMSNIFPILKENVGWIFQYGDLYFNSAKLLGLLLIQLCNGCPAKTTKFVMEFIVYECNEKVMSPNSLFFLTTSLCHGVFSRPVNTGHIGQDYCCDDFLQCVEYFNQYLGKGLITLDNFLKHETHKQLSDIFLRLVTITNKNKRIEKIERYENTILQFIGNLDLEIFSSSSFVQFCQNELGSIIIDLEGLDEESIISKDIFSSKTQTKGFCRLLYIKIIQDPEIIKNLEDCDRDPQIQALICKLESMGHEKTKNNCIGLNDYFKCIWKHYYYHLKNPCADWEGYWWWLSSSISKSIESLLNYCYKYINNNTIHDDKEFCCNNFLNITCILRLLENLAVQSSSRSCQQMQPSLLCGTIINILRNQLCTYESKIWDHGHDGIRNPYIDEVIIRLFGIFVKLNNTQCNLPMVPSFLISKLTFVLDRTDFKNYNTITKNTFKTKFQEFKLQTLTQIILANDKESVVSYFANIQDDVLIKIWLTILELLDTSGPQGVIHVLDFASAVVSFQSTTKLSVELNDMINKFAKVSWVQIFDMRKTEGFWTGYKKYLEFIMKPYFMQQGTLIEVWDDIITHSENVMGIASLFMEKLADSFNNSVSAWNSWILIEAISKICVKATYFGPMPASNMKTTVEIWNYLKKVEGGDPEATDYYCTPGDKIVLSHAVFSCSRNTRLWGLVLILKLLETLKSTNTEFYNTLLRNIVDELLNKLDQEKRERYFCNEWTHRIRQRICQALLIFQPYFDEDMALIVTRRLLKSLNVDHQPSVRYMMEWIIAKNLISYPSKADDFFKKYEEIAGRRVTFGCNFGTICFHVISNLNNTVDVANFLSRCLDILTELSMGQHVTVQAVSQVCFRRIYEHCQSTFSSSSLPFQDYSLVYRSLCKHMEKKHKTTMNEKLENNFYMKSFNPIKHYNAQTIFIYLPKISNVASDEIMLEKDLLHILDVANSSNDTFKVPVDSDQALRQLYDTTSWHLQAGLLKGENREMGEETIGEGPVDGVKRTEQATFTHASNVFQKKITPWKYLPMPEFSDFAEEIQLKKKRCTEDGLILVASLISKATNLGGLCRTSEIFGVSKFVISSLKLMQDQSFQNLSVSAEKWVTVLEVPKNGLREFLTTYSLKGYTIFGIEQASDSIKLNSNFKFPKKSVLLLGDEKFGIPPELLQVVDHCLEIPQIGITRSLNVHVTGALCIWQYASQYFNTD